MEENRLRIAIQKSGRLSDGSLELLKSCGLRISRGRDKLYARVRELPIDILFVRDDDIPAFVGDGACDLGIVGENVFEEHRAEREESAVPIRVQALGFSRCRLMLAAPGDWPTLSNDAFNGKRIATSYPGLLQAFLEREGIDAKPVIMQGAVEVAPRLKIADAICDIVSTGATLEANGLAAAATVFESEALLIRAPGSADQDTQRLIDALVKRINGVIASRDAKYVMMNAPRDAVDAITAILPGAEAPTILELAGDADRVAIHAMCTESVFWTTLEDLKAHGASAILVLPVEKMMP
ncbi:MAG: ATP phosphoribosyltransferase [Pseudomonadota bacterium]